MAEESTQPEETLEIDMNEGEARDEVATDVFSDEFTNEENIAFLKRQLAVNTVVKKHTSTVPTHSPKNFYEQIVLYESGATIRLYIWVNSTWRYIALT